MMEEKTQDAHHALSLVQGREWMRRSHGLRRRTEGRVDVKVAGGSTRDGKAESYQEGVYRDGVYDSESPKVMWY